MQRFVRRRLPAPTSVQCHIKKVQGAFWFHVNIHPLNSIVARQAQGDNIGRLDTIARKTNGSGCMARPEVRNDECSKAASKNSFRVEFLTRHENDDRATLAG